MFLAKTAQYSLRSFLESAFRTHVQNLKPASSPSSSDLDRLLLLESLYKARKQGGADRHFLISLVCAELSDEEEQNDRLEQEDEVRMSRTNNHTGKRHKNSAGSKASSKHRKTNNNNKGNNKSRNSHCNNKQRGGNRAIRGTSAGWYAVSAMQGRREYMEDTYSVVIPGDGGDLHSLFGVFDGHGGKKVALYLKEHLLPAIVEAYEQEKSKDDNDPDFERTPVQRLQTLLPRVFLEIDKQCIADDPVSGSTAVVAILTESDIVVANVGDSRGIIYRTRSSNLEDSNDSEDVMSIGSADDDTSEDLTEDATDTDTDNDTDDEMPNRAKGKAKQTQRAPRADKKGKKKRKGKPQEGPVGKTGRWQLLSVDHKPNRPDERERLESAGGRVTQRPNDVWRFQNVLAVSRAFGDYGLKSSFGGSGLTAEPEIKVFPRQENDKCIVLASDGLWDVFTNEQAAKTARDVLQCKKNHAQEVANALVSGAYQKESLDNITVLVVLLDEISDVVIDQALPDSADEASLHSEL